MQSMADRHTFLVTAETYLSVTFQISFTYWVSVVCGEIVTKKLNAI